MNILVLDDVEERVLTLKKYCPNSEVTHCTNVQDFISAAQKDTYDLIILDHDLPLDKDECKKNGFAYIDNYCSDRHGLTGMDAVKYLCADVFHTDKEQKILIWSWSENASLMEKKLLGAGFKNTDHSSFSTHPNYWIELAHHKVI